MLKRQLLYQSVHFQDTIQNSWIPLLCCFSDQHPCPGLCHQRSQELQTRRVYPWRNGPGTSSSKYDTQPHPSPKIINKNTKDSMETYRNLGSQSLRRFFFKDPINQNGHFLVLHGVSHQQTSRALLLLWSSLKVLGGESGSNLGFVP